MKIKTVSFSALFNLGNYSNEKIGFTVQLDEGETVDQVIESLRQKTRECALPNIDDVRNAIRQARLDLNDLENKLYKARKEWDATVEFLTKQGIKPDAAYMPRFNYLLPAIGEESIEVVDESIEVVDEKDDIHF